MPTSPISFSMTASVSAVLGHRPRDLEQHGRLARAEEAGDAEDVHAGWSPSGAAAGRLRGPAGEQLGPEVLERELVAGRGDDEVVAPVALHERVQDARRARDLLDREVERLGEVGDARPVRLHVVAAGVDEHDARVVLEQQAHHLLGALAAALLHELLVLAHDGVALFQVRLGDVVAAALLLGLGGEGLVGAEQHGDAVVDPGHDERGVLGLEAEHGVGAEAVAEHDGRAGLVGLGHGGAQRLLEPLGADVQLRLELVAVDALGGAVGELADDGRAGDELQPARPFVAAPDRR